MYIYIYILLFCNRNLCNGALRRGDIFRVVEIMQLMHNFMDIKMNRKDRAGEIYTCIIRRDYLFRRYNFVYIVRDLRKIKKRKKNVSQAL